MKEKKEKNFDKLIRERIGEALRKKEQEKKLNRNSLEEWEKSYEKETGEKENE